MSHFVSFLTLLHSLMFLQSMVISLVPELITSHSSSENSSLAHLSAGISAKASSAPSDRAFLSDYSGVAFKALAAPWSAAAAYEPTCLSSLERGPRNLIDGMRPPNERYMLGKRREVDL